jgi:hypothetical protein
MRVDPGIDEAPIYAAGERRCKSNIERVARSLEPVTYKVAGQKVTGRGTHFFKAEPTRYENFHK